MRHDWRNPQRCGDADVAQELLEVARPVPPLASRFFVGKARLLAERGTEDERGVIAKPAA
jgi:hypothetical protein